MNKRPRDSDAAATVEYVFAEGALFTADEFTDEMRNRIDPSEITCAQCLGRVHFVQSHGRTTSRDVRAHFKHTAQKANSHDIESHHGYESDEHFRLKYLIARDFQSIVFKARCCDRGPFRDYTFPHAAEAIVEMTIPGTRDRPDVTLKGKDGQILAFIEVWITHRRINWRTLSNNASLNFQIKTEAWESTIGVSLKPICEECKQREPPLPPEQPKPPESQTHTPMEITQVSVSPPQQETQVVPASRPPPPAALDEDTRSRARMLASQVKPDSFEDWSMLGFALYTIFGGSDEGLHLFLSLWSGRPMFDEVKARRCYRIAEGKLGMGYLMRKAYSPPVPLFSPEYLCSLTAPIKSEIASLGKDEVAKLAALQKDLETISVDYLNQFFLVIVDEKPIICREVGKGLKQTKYAEAVNVNWACIKREFKLWNESPGRRSFQGLTFDPSVIGHTTCEGEPYYNLYKGPEHPYDPDYDMSNCEANIKPLIDHMFKILCDGNKEEFNYLLKWCANAVQNPSKPNRVAVVLQGAQGCGKGIFVNKFKDIYGKAYFYQVMDQQSFLGTFAPENMEQCLTCFVDEAFFPGNMRDVQIIKKLVTEESREIEKKYGSRRSFKNYTNYIFASNSHYVVHNDPQERRFFVIKPNNRYAGVSSAATDAYIQSVLDVPTADFAQYLYRVDLTGFNARNFPRTEGSKQQKQHTLNPVGTWWDSVLREGYIPNLVDFRLPDRQAVSTVAMFKTFTDWHKDSKQPGRMTSGMPQFTILFMEFLTIRGEKEPICRKMRKKQDGDAKVNMWQFPPLEALKKCFAQHMDVPTWFDDDEPGSTNEPAPKRHRSSSPVRPPLSETPPTVAHYPFTAPPRQPPPLPPKTSPAARPDPVVMDIERDTIARHDRHRELTGECPYSN